MATVLDLTELPVVDNHCHAVLSAAPDTDVAGWRAHFTEAADPGMRDHDSADTVFYRRLMRRLRRFHDLPDDADESSVLAARSRWGTVELTGRLLRDAGVAGLVVDTGYPPAELALTGADLAAATGVAQVELLRLEPLFETLVSRSDTLAELREALAVELADARAHGWAGFKSVVGYRTGLAVARWSDGDAQTAFAAARAEVARTGSVRLGHQPLLDTLLHDALAQASAQGVAVQVHVGYGDPDVDLRSASPLHLRAVLEDPAYRGLRLVLLHGCWPYFREGAFLASVYPQAYLDLSYAIPFLSLRELTSVTRAALGTAPVSKLLYSSDGVGVPELHWIGAHDGRRALATVLGELVDDGDLDRGQAHDTARRILSANAWALYGFAGTAP